MKTAFATAVCLLLMSCAPPPVSKEAHVRQVKSAIAKAGGETNVLNESRILFKRLHNREPVFILQSDELLQGLRGITNLGEPFDYSQSDRIRIRVYNSHSDVFSIYLVNPDDPIPETEHFERIAGNVGFIEPGGAANRSQPIRSETNTTSAAAGSGR